MAAAGDQDELFGDMGFHGYMQQFVHRKLHMIAERFAPEKLLELGQMSFREQFASLGLPSPEEERRAPPTTQAAAARPTSSVAPSIFGPMGRSGYLHQKIHKKLHPYVIPMSDKELLDLGKLGVDDQFNYMGQTGPSDGGLFAGTDREGYLQQRVHRRLHIQARTLSDEDLYNLGQMKFNDQFSALEETFGTQDRNTYVQAHIHRKLHARIVGMSDEDVLALGKLNFNEQFNTLGIDGPSLNEQMSATNVADFGVFGSLDRESYIQARVHRKLHPQITHMSDEEVLHLGKLSFNEQFRTLGLDAAPVPIDQVLPFGALDRDTYIQQHIHRRLHHNVASLPDEDVVHVGRQSFNEQFRLLGVDMTPTPSAAPTAAPRFSQPAQPPVVVQPLRGLSRAEYMNQRIHKKLHPQAGYLSDQEMTDVGELSFAEQFGALEAVLARKKPSGGKGKGPPPPSTGQAGSVFGGLDRDSFMQQRVHRRLHGRALRLDDESLAKLGRLSFNEQFPTMDQLDGLTTVA